jgi:hypothetical protein
MGKSSRPDRLTSSAQHYLIRNAERGPEISQNSGGLSTKTLTNASSKNSVLNSSVQESLPEILDRDKITAATIELNSIVLGTHDGYVHVLSFTGELVKSIKAHDRPVNAISVDGSGHTIAR